MLLAVSLALTACSLGTPPEAGPGTQTPSPSAAVTPEPTTPPVPPVREQLTIDFPPYIALPEGLVTHQQATPLTNGGTYWLTHIHTDTPFEDVVAPILAAGSLQQISYADARGPLTADGTGHAIVFVAGLSVNLNVSRGVQDHDYVAAFVVQPGTQAETRVRDWFAVGLNTSDWRTAPVGVVPASFPTDLALPSRPPYPPSPGNASPPEWEGVPGVAAQLLTRDENEAEQLLQAWLHAGWVLEMRSNVGGVNAVVRKGEVEAMLHFHGIPFYDAWNIRVIVWDPAA